MASTLRTVPLLRVVQARSYASAAVPIGGLADFTVQKTVLPNKALVVSADNQSAICRVSILFKAGARCETAETAGTAHMLRICAGLSTRTASQFAITRNIQEVGGSLKCTTDREIVAYTLEGTRAAIEQLMPYLTTVTTQQIFKPWEVSDNVNRVRLELLTRPPQQRAIDLFHKAAYRTGLGNSIYMPKHQVGKISSEDLQHYVCTNFVADRAAVVGLGVDHRDLAQYATCLSFPNGTADLPASSYKGGEIRSDKGGDYAFIAIGTEGAAGIHLKEALTFGILKKAYGTSPAARPWGGNSCGLMSKNSDPTTSIKAFSLNYSDSGLFGAIIAAESKHAGKHIEMALSVLKSGSISDADVNRGKNQLKRSILSAMESGFECVYRMGVGALINKEALTANAVADIVDEITIAEVQSAAKKVASGKLTITSVGNLRNVPFLSDLQ